MPIIFPITSAAPSPSSATWTARGEGEGLSVAALRLRPLALRATSAGSSSSSADAFGSANRFRARGRGGSQTWARLSLSPLKLRATSAGSSRTRATLRVNGESPVALTAHGWGDSQTRAAMRVLLRFVSVLAGGSSTSAELTSESAFDVSFTIGVEVIPAELAPALERVYRPRLTADGGEVPIKSFRLEAGEGALGTSLVCSLADPRPASVSRFATYQLDLGVLTSPGAYRFEPLLAGARYGGRDHTVALERRAPADSLTLRFIDRLGDRWQLAPARDTSFLGQGADEDGARPDALSVLRDERGQAIYPVKVRVPNLTIREALRRCYVTGCGFAGVETNLPDYALARLDVSRAAGWHESLAGLLALYDPIYGGEGSRLRIIDADQPVAAGSPVYDLPLGSLVTVKDSQPLAQLFDAIELVYEERRRDREIAVGEETESDPPIQAGSFGDPGFTSTKATRTFRLFARETDTATITRRELLRELVTMHNAEGELVHRETTQARFDSLGRKAGHTRTIEQLVPTQPDGELMLLESMREINEIVYRAHPTEPGKSVQDANTTRTSGLVLVDNENTYLDRPFPVPLVEAHRGGTFDIDADQVIEWRAIKTRTARLIFSGGGQMINSVLIYDALAKTTQTTTAEPVVGDSTLDARRMITRRVLVTLSGNAPAAGATVRRSLVLSVGALPRAEAIRLARRKLARLNDPGRRVSISLPAVDFSIRRGSIVRAHNREGASGLFIVTGYAITGERLGTRDQKITMTLDAKELTAGRSSS